MPIIIAPSAASKPETATKEPSDTSLRGRYRNSRLPIVAKWSLAIGTLLTIVVGLLGSALIAQQAQGFMQRTEVFGRILVEQMAHSASEPIMADDDFTLSGLVNRQIKSQQVLGALILKNDNILTEAGVNPSAAEQSKALHAVTKQVIWSWRDNTGKERKAITFATSIRYKDVSPGYALITLDHDQFDQELRESALILVYTTFGLILLGIALAYALSRSLSRPIEVLAQAGEIISRGDPIDKLAHQRNDEIGCIVNSFNLMAEGMREKDRVEQAFARYVSPHAAPRLLANLEQPALASEQIYGSVLFCDVVGFTRLTESMPPRKVADMLNEYLGYIALAGHSCQGMVDKFIGDSVMIVFGAPERDKKHALHAVTCGVMIQEIVSHINQHRQQEKLQPLYFRIGINSGEMMVGNIGVAERMQYTVVGDTVNLGSRLCGMAPSGGILICSSTALQPGVRKKVDMKLQPLRKVKGRSQFVSAYRVYALNPTYQQRMQKVMRQVLPAKHAS